jgi:hypothetical protein
MATVVVVRCGQSEALRWEMDQLRESGKLDRTLFLLPPARLPRELRDFLPEGAVFDIQPTPAPTEKRYPAFVTLSAQGAARIHERDLQLGYGESAKQVAAEAFGLEELTRGGRQVIRGFYGKTEQALSTITMVCAFGAIYGMAGAMLAVLLVLLPILLTQGRAEDVAVDLLAPIVMPLLTVSGVVAAVSMGVIVLMLAIRERLVP